MKKQKHKKPILWKYSILVLLLIISSCNDLSDEPEIPLTKNENEIFEGQIEVGGEIANPYSVNNMQATVLDLQQSGELKSAIKVEATHYYVRFLPKNEQELEVLKSDANLFFYDYPLLKKIEKGGTYYHDPSLPSDQITWQYTVVPADYRFDTIQYEILDDAFMPDEDELGEKSTDGSLDLTSWYIIEKAAFERAGYDVDDVGMKSTSWTPSGKITVEDDYLGTIPVEGALVRARNILKVREGLTRSDGTFSVDGSFTAKDVEISIKWERWDFDIRHGSYGQAYVHGGDLDRGKEWNVRISSGHAPNSWLHAHIHRAAMVYYYECGRWGIKAPPRRDGVFGALNHRLHIAGKDEDGRSHYFDFNHFWLAAQVVVRSNRTNSNIVYHARHIFGTTIHELAHASHWEWAYSTKQYVLDWLDSEPKVPESWAVGVAWQVTNECYGLDINSSGNFDWNYQVYNLSKIPTLDGYTPLVIDLIDNVNQSIYNSARPNDQVTGYTLGQLENALLFVPNDGIIGWELWRKHIKEWYNNPTEGYVDYLFDNYK